MAGRRVPLRRLALSAAYAVFSLRWRLFHVVTVGVRLILLSNGRVMLIRHSYQPGWRIPGGGVKRGESLLDAALREAREEVGAIALEPPVLVGMYVNFDEGRNDHMAVFLCESFYLVEPSDKWEIESRALFDVENLPKSISPRVRGPIIDAMQGKRGIIEVW